MQVGEEARRRELPGDGELAAGEDRLLATAGPVLARLRDITGESVQVYRREGAKRVCVAAMEPPTVLRDTVPVGTRFPMSAGSAAKVLLAWADPATQRALVPDSVFSERALYEIRRRGWAQSAGERAAGVASVSAPARDANGDVVAATGPEGGLAIASFDLPATLARARRALVGELERALGSVRAAVAAGVRDGGMGLQLPLLLCLGALLAVAQVECGAETGAMLPAEASGRHLALWSLARDLWLLFWLDLLAAVFLPLGLAPEAVEAPWLAWPLGLLAWAAKLLAVGAVFALAGALVAGMRRQRLPELLGAALLLAVLGAVLLFLGARVA